MVISCKICKHPLSKDVPNDAMFSGTVTCNQCNSLMRSRIDTDTVRGKFTMMRNGDIGVDEFASLLFRVLIDIDTLLK